MPAFGEVINDVEVLRTGTHTAASGKEVAFTTADLDAIAAAYRADYHETPVVIGHPADNQPAYGWVVGLKRVGERLVATLDVLPAFAEAIRQGLFKKRSASVYADLDGQGPYLRHVGFLGAMPPAIKALADINLIDGADSETLEFSHPTLTPALSLRERGNRKGKEGLMNWKDKVKGLFSQAVDEIPEAGTPTAVTVVAPSSTAAQFSEADVKARETAAAEAAAKKARDEATAEFAEQQRQKDAQAAVAQHKTAVKAKIDALVAQAKVAPAWVKSGLAEFVEALPWCDPALIEFADAEGKAVKKAPFDWFVDFLEGLPKFVNLDEIAGGGKDVSKDLDARRDKAVTDFQEREKCDYRTAVLAVSKEHPELFSRTGE